MKGCEMDNSSISEFGKHDLAAVGNAPWLSKPRYAVAHDSTAPGLNSLQVFRNHPTPPWMIRIVDGSTVVATTLLTVWLGRGHLSREQAATLVTADLVAVLTFFLMSRIRDYQTT
jgi:hypothetical protein